MNSSNKNQDNSRDIPYWFTIVLITAVALFCNYHYAISGPVQIIVWLLWFILSLTLAYMTSKGKLVFEFAKEAKVELLKVVWPTRQETVQTTIIVMIMVALTGFVLWGLDSVVMWAIAKITHLG